MDRERGYRAWDGHKMYYADFDELVSSLGSQSAGSWTPEEELGAELAGFAGQLPGQTMSAMIYMESTGVLDKKGKKIYEGDIIRVPGNYVVYGTHNAAVEWSDKQLGWVTSSGLKMLNSSPDALPELKIIGNIYENPELLEEERKQQG